MTSTGCRSKTPELFLPVDLIARASRHGDDHAWRRRDLLHVADASEKAGIACGGWKVLFRTPDGDGELCWYSYYSPGGNVSEPWPEFVVRSWQDSRHKWRELFEDPELVEEGRKAFRLLKATEASALLPRDVLWFIIYFIPSGSEERERHPPSRTITRGSIAEEMETGLCQAE